MNSVFLVIVSAKFIAAAMNYPVLKLIATIFMHIYSKSACNELWHGVVHRSCNEFNRKNDPKNRVHCMDPLGTPQKFHCSLQGLFPQTVYSKTKTPAATSRLISCVVNPKSRASPMVLAFLYLSYLRYL